jgi:hypothetical protein
MILKNSMAKRLIIAPLAVLLAPITIAQEPLSDADFLAIEACEAAREESALYSIDLNLTCEEIVRLSQPAPIETVDVGEEEGTN